MVVLPSSEQAPDAAHFTGPEHARHNSPDDTPIELLSYVEDMIVFLQHFDEQTSVHEIKAFLASLEQRANHHFCFLFHQSSRRVRLPSDTHCHFSLQFGKLIYGTLCVKKQADQPDMPAFPLPLARHLSRLCGWLLHTCEQSMFIWSYQQPAFSTYEKLTRREREVLSLMCRGYGLEDVARTLTITPATVNKHKQHIYQQLGVHTVRDALHASYHYGLVSFLDGLYEWREY